MSKQSVIWQTAVLAVLFIITVFSGICAAAAGSAWVFVSMAALVLIGLWAFVLDLRLRNWE